MQQRLGARRSDILRFARLDHCAVERGQRFCQQGVLARNPVEPARGGAQGGERTVGPFPDMAQFLQIAGQPLALLHVGPGGGERASSPAMRFQRGQFGQMREQQILIQRACSTSPRAASSRSRGLPRVPARRHAR